MNPSVELKLCNALNRLLDYGIIFIISAPIILDAYYCKIQEKDLYSYSEPYPVLYKDFDPEGWEFASNHLEPIPADADNGVCYEHDIYKASNLTLAKGYKELVAACALYSGSDVVTAYSVDEAITEDSEANDYTLLVTAKFCTDDGTGE